MFMKSIFAATAVAATLAGAAPAAQAKHHHHVDLGINIGVPTCGSGYYDPACDYPPPPPPPRPHHVYMPDYGYDSGYGGDYGYGDGGYDSGYDRLSCGEGRQIVRQSGWRGVRPFDCDGQNYKYTGFRRGDNWVIVLDSRTGTIIRRYRN